MEMTWLERLQQQLKTSNTVCHILSVNHNEQTEIAQYFKGQRSFCITEWVALDETRKTIWCVLYLYAAKFICTYSELPVMRPMIKDLSDYFPIANRLQRAIYDLTKIPTQGSTDKRSWLSHGNFPTGVLNSKARHHSVATPIYRFNKVAGDGVHEIPVGPVHAGVIEPGHFRFSVVGERVLKLEERFGYAHKGVHGLLIGKTKEQGAKIIGRISGDATVAYSFAYAQACEQFFNCEVDTTTARIRAVLLERERLANHIGDLGGIINDTGFTSLQSQFLILKEEILRENVNLTGHRYLMDSIIPCQNMPAWGWDVIQTMQDNLKDFAKQLIELQNICSHHHGLRDRLVTTGIVTNDIAQKLGLLGLVAKASGIAIDTRHASLQDPYRHLVFTPVTEQQGDVAARVNVRFAECQQSIALIQHFLLESTTNTGLQKSKELFGFGCAESWRGPVTVAVRFDNNVIQWCHFHEPSWQNWLALEYALLNNIVADFPLINKSFNLSYSGQDS